MKLQNSCVVLILLFVVKLTLEAGHKSQIKNVGPN